MLLATSSCTTCGNTRVCELATRTSSALAQTKVAAEWRVRGFRGIIHSAKQRNLTELTKPQQGELTKLGKSQRIYNELTRRELRRRDWVATELANLVELELLELAECTQLVQLVQPVEHGSLCVYCSQRSNCIRA